MLKVELIPGPHLYFFLQKKIQFCFLSFSELSNPILIIFAAFRSTRLEFSHEIMFLRVLLTWIFKIWDQVRWTAFVSKFFRKFTFQTSDLVSYNHGIPCRADCRLFRDVFVDRKCNLWIDLCDFYHQTRVLYISSAELADREWARPLRRRRRRRRYGHLILDYWWTFLKSPESIITCSQYRGLNAEYF